MDKRYIKPTKIIAFENADCIEKIINDWIPQAILYDYADENQISHTATIRNGGYVVLDFGKEISGGINITTCYGANETSKFQIVFGESVAEAMSELGQKNSSNAHSVRDIIVSAVNLGSQTYGDTAFRFVKIQALNGDIQIHTIKAVSLSRNIEYKGSFECSDELLNQIWKTGAYTVELNMNEYLWDGAKRDRLVWIGDMHPELMTVNCVFGKDACIEKSLDLVAGVTPADKWMNGIATYSMWWLIIQHDYYLHWGDFEYLKKSEKTITNIAEHLFEWTDSGFFGSDMTTFVDWSSKDTKSELMGVKAIAVIALEKSAVLFNYISKPEYAKKCFEYAKKIKSEGVSGEINTGISSLCVVAGYESEYINQKISDACEQQMSCFMGYYTLLAKAKLGQYSEALDLIRKYWGAMLSIGATTFWEEFDVAWIQNSARIDEIPKQGQKDIHGDFGKYCYDGYRKSLCHGWASGPTAFLSEIIGGIEILEPGCKKLKIASKLSGLDFVNITYPTPFGSIKIHTEKIGNDIKVNIDAPCEIEIIK